jgi:hypothetical protein
MQPRRTVGIIALLALLSFVAAAQEAPSVPVTGGKIRGAIRKDGGAVFKGIPFAAPRWAIGVGGNLRPYPRGQACATPPASAHAVCRVATG